MNATAEQVRDAQDAQQAQVEVHANDILRGLHHYEDLIERVADNPRIQQELHLLAIASTEYMTRTERTIVDALREAAIEKATEELS